MEPRTVEILESSFVVPSDNTPSERLTLSNIDLLVPRNRNCTLYLYKDTRGANDFFAAELLKSALAKALVLFYPLAGRQVVGHDGRDQVVCNAEGVLFVVARLDRTTDSIQFEPMSPELIEFFIPKGDHLSSLVTYLKCGTSLLGISTSHIRMDGRSFADFYQTWSRIARGDLKSIVPPSFDNSPLRARSPPKISFDFSEYTTDEQPTSGSVSTTNDPDSCVLSVLRLSKEQIRHLKNRCNEGRKDTSVSTFCAVSALVWKLYCIAKGLLPDNQSRLYFPADLRSRLSPLLTAYFGNAAMRICAASEVSKIISNPMGDVARTVKAVIDGFTDEYIRSFFDFLEVNSNKKFAGRGTSESDLLIRTITREICEIDFGWGLPQVYSWERCTVSKVIYIINEPGKDGCIKVVPALDSSTMQRFKKVFYEELLELDVPSCDEL